MSRYKLCFFVPMTHAIAVKRAIFATGAGTIGNYKHCAFQVKALEYQVNDRFLDHAVKHPSWAPWTEDNSVFVMWIGINDCQQGQDEQAQLTQFFQLQEKLYKHGHHDPVVRNRILRWNGLLTQFTFTFTQRHSSTLSAIIYDTHILFTEVLDDPEKYGFKDNFSKCHAKECIWDDDLHPTFVMHEVVARDLARVLASGV